MSAYTWAPWVGARACTAGPTAGARALLAWALEAFPRGRSLGIYNCRSVRGSSTTSLHGEGRAVDVGFPVIGGRAHADGRALVDALGRHGHRLGIQAAIFDRTIWSASSPAGRVYTGVAPHVDHVHVELTWAAAERLNLATLRQVTGLPRPTTVPAPIGAEPMLTVDARGPAVALFMACLVAEAKANRNRTGPAAEGMPRSRTDGGGFDGIFGPEMTAAVRTYQAGARIPVTGAVDGLTASLLVRYAPNRHT